MLAVGLCGWGFPKLGFLRSDRVSTWAHPHVTQGTQGLLLPTVSISPSQGSLCSTPLWETQANLACQWYHARPFTALAVPCSQRQRRGPLVIGASTKVIMSASAGDCYLDEVKSKSALQQGQLTKRKILPVSAKHFRSLRKNKC